MEQFFHHSLYLRFRSPQGAACCGAAVRLAAEVSGAFAAAAITVRLWTDAGEVLVPMAVDGGVARAEIRLPDAPGLVWYYFIIHFSDGTVRYCGGRSGAGALYDHEPPAWRITVYDAAFTTPRWFTEGLCYQIFPDRFRRSSWEDFYTRAQQCAAEGLHPRIHDRWSDDPLISPPPGQNEYEPNDFFGGDLNGIRAKLGYLAELGVTCIYLNPVFSSVSNHRYNTSDYLHIDTLLGTDEDFAALCREAKALGIRIMLDGVFSHTGADSRYFNQEGRYPDPGACQSKDSPYYEWYRFSDWPDKYECWWNFPSLPNVEELCPSYTAFIAGDNGVLERWAALGATSWRLDVADELPDAFIRLLRRKIKSLDPEAVLMGEVWEEPTDKRGPEGRRGYPDGDELDCVMNYTFTEAAVAFLTDKIDGFAFASALSYQREMYPKPFYEAALNLLSSHDVVRAATALSGAPSRLQMSREQQARYAPAPEAQKLGKARLLLGTAIQIALPGTPCVYYGDEVGMMGMSDPFNRGAYPWGGGDTALFSRMQPLLTARMRSAALRSGRCRMGALSPDVFCIVRYTEGGCAILFVNRSAALQRTHLTPDMFPEGPDGESPMPLPGVYENQYGSTAEFSDCIEQELAPLSATLWIRGER